jgi:hypothetical protein
MVSKPAMNSGSLGSARQTRFLPPKALVSLNEFAMKFTASFCPGNPPTEGYVRNSDAVLDSGTICPRLSLSGAKLTILGRETAFPTC